MTVSRSARTSRRSSESSPRVQCLRTSGSLPSSPAALAEARQLPKRRHADSTRPGRSRETWLRLTERPPLARVRSSFRIRSLVHFQGPPAGGYRLPAAWTAARHPPKYRRAASQRRGSDLRTLFRATEGGMSWIRARISSRLQTRARRGRSGVRPAVRSARAQDPYRPRAERCRA